MYMAYASICICHHREIITSRFAPEYFPNIPPSVEYLAEEVPVPIPKTDNNKYVQGSTDILCIIQTYYVYNT